MYVVFLVSIMKYLKVLHVADELPLNEQMWGSLMLTPNNSIYAYCLFQKSKFSYLCTLNCMVSIIW